MPDKFQNKYRIPSAWLPGYDYGENGAYFITICTKNRIHYFGEIIDAVETQYFASQKTHDNLPQEETQNVASLQPTPIGMIANGYCQKIPEHFPFVILDEFVVMPNHMHGILIINKQTQDSSVIETHNDASLQEIGYANKFGPQSGNISSVIRGYKAAVKSFATTNKIDFGWQSRFYDRIIRDYDELKRIRKYIAENPDNWQRDRNNKEDLYM
jgi:REP element-mobilizing transposase RayT